MTGSAADQRRTAFGRIPSREAVELTADGVWRIRSFTAARRLLRAEATRQAGFMAELVEKRPQRGKTPILFLEGQLHHEQRRMTAPFFTPKAVSTRYRGLMEALADQVLARFRNAGSGDLSLLGMEMAVGVAAEVVGLTDSVVPGLDRRINAFFSGSFDGSGGRLRRIWRALLAQVRLLRFHLLDVRPAIAKRRAAPREDVISHLLSQGYGPTEILTECILYGAAGMVTTREFITVCAWHLLEDEALRTSYLAADEAVRHQLLEEMLRLEPVVGTIYRRTTTDIAVEPGEPAIPAGALVAVDLRAVHADPAIAGDDPLAIRQGRCPSERAGAAMMSFGDGHHRCPGSFLAIQEADTFLIRLLAIPGLRLERAPDVGWNELVTGYELRGCLLRCDPPGDDADHLP